jgi:hypothetical protein
MDIRLFDGSIKTSDAELGYVLDRIGSVVDRIADAAGHIDVRLADVQFSSRVRIAPRCALRSVLRRTTKPSMQPHRGCVARSRVHLIGRSAEVTTSEGWMLACRVISLRNWPAEEGR